MRALPLAAAFSYDVLWVSKILREQLLLSTKGGLWGTCIHCKAGCPELQLLMTGVVASLLLILGSSIVCSGRPLLKRCVPAVKTLPILVDLDQDGKRAEKQPAGRSIRKHDIAHGDLSLVEEDLDAWIWMDGHGRMDGHMDLDGWHMDLAGHIPWI